MIYAMLKDGINIEIPDLFFKYLTNFFYIYIFFYRLTFKNADYVRFFSVLRVQSYFQVYLNRVSVQNNSKIHWR